MRQLLTSCSFCLNKLNTLPKGTTFFPIAFLLPPTAWFPKDANRGRVVLTRNAVFFEEKEHAHKNVTSQNLEGRTRQKRRGRGWVGEGQGREDVVHIVHKTWWYACRDDEIVTWSINLWKISELWKKSDTQLK